jgi:hydrogenase maturation protein HypF
MSMGAAGRRIVVRGVVQGVGFRPWVYRLAHEHGLAGRVRNDAAGVTIDVFGDVAALDAFVEGLRTGAPAAARIDDLEAREIPPEPIAGFRIEASAGADERRVSIPPDLATCDACLSEVGDPADRRYRYAFTNCTHCGPRFTIAREVPYDRATTTMAGFVMCASCRAEYESVRDRRFHAQPIACPACGPQLTLLAADGVRIASDDAVRDAARALLDGRILAVKGLGGFHLACDATQGGAVARLRQRKRREEKPLAVMVRDLAEAERLAEIGTAERRLLTSVERPIVLVARRPSGGIAGEVAPGSDLLGLLLPYTPLHHLLLHEVGRPLVMTSGNLSEEPLAFHNDEAVRRLGGIADLFLVHDREIEAPCDDSVARVIAGTPTLMRRARGYVPRPRPVARRFDRPVLACGAHLKNTFCIGEGEFAHLGPHVGDLENLETFAAYEAAIARMERFLRVRPEVIAHDLHPAYLSTRYALARSEAVKVPVQHHHAHVASAMAEHGLEGRVLGVAYDGTGLGSDGAAWGGELLVADYRSFERVATLRPLPLAGGDTAIREVWRLALALLDDAFEGGPPLEALALFREVKPSDVEIVRQMIRSNLNAPPAHGVGRYFDALGALGLVRRRSAYEGQVALDWNLAADPSETGSYSFTISTATSPWQLDLREMVRQAVRELIAGQSPRLVSARFHNTLVAATAALVRAAREAFGGLPVVLTGGCFQNPWLAERLVADLGRECDVRLHGEVPPGDGGLALGQALVAEAVARDSA